MFRCVLGLALLAWTMLAFGGFARPLAMVSGNAATSAMMKGKAALSHCGGMTTSHAKHDPHPTPSHPAGDGHGCCHNGDCHCAFSCSGIAVLPFGVMGWQPLQRSAHRALPARIAPIDSAPPLRPPIA